MSELRIHGASYNFGTYFTELFNPVTEGDNLSRANECAAKTMINKLILIYYIITFFKRKILASKFDIYYDDGQRRPYLQIQRVEEEHEVFPFIV